MISRQVFTRLGWLLFVVLLLLGLRQYTHAQPVPSRAIQARYGAQLVAWTRTQLYLRELTGNNDAPEIDAWARANGVALRSSWCGLYQWKANKVLGLPTPRGAAGSYNWALDPVRTYYLRNRRGTLDSLKVGHRVMFYYSNLGRIGHIGLAVAASRKVRAGRPARGFIINAGNTGRGGGRNGAGVYDLFYASSDIYAAANWNY
ncbi:hypothetical protein [Hymenobacter nivis]|uniref:CHAP domain-containing protein n=1 Tax=Hymenobacter nivis TaxID=1850093 RepID=A0A502GX73_9BACT|nr:hypothetical protein [Hymenobacter nivis]TPG66052.1 hypothetical protein EAH73_11830 [Hymenobacter nivis]